MNSFALQADEAGISLYRLKMCTIDAIMGGAPGPGFGLVRIRRSDLPDGVHVVPTHSDEQPNLALRMAHVELRYPTEDGGQDYTYSMKKAMARAAAHDNLLIEPDLP